MNKVTLLVTSLFFMLVSAAQAQAATVTFTSPTTSFTPDTASSVNLNANLLGVSASAITLRVDVTGDVPADIALTPDTFAASGNSLELVTNFVSDITGGKRFVLAFVSPLSDADGYTNNAVTRFGVFNFTAPSTGSLTFTLVNTSEIADQTTYANLITTFPTTTFEVTTAPANTPTASPTATATPTNTPTASPTATATPTQSPITGNLNIDFRLEGVTHDAVAQPITFTLKDPTSGSTLDTITQTLTPQAGQNGLYHTSLTSVPGGTIKVCIKGLSHLQRCTVAADDNNQPSAKVHHPAITTQGQTVSIDLATNDLNHLIVGDVDNDNKITLSDSTSILIQYTAFSRDVSGLPTHPPQDVNYDNRISIDDVALNSMNFSDFVVCGDDAVAAACTQ